MQSVTNPLEFPSGPPVDVVDEASATPRGVLDEASATPLDAVREAVRRTFGFESLRPLQERAIAAVLAGRDALVVMPTGGGKSLCYQAPALVRPGLALVVSPLISLMKDQVDGLVANGVAAAMMSSAQSPAELRAVWEALERGRVSLLFVAPERLALSGFVESLVERGLSSLAVDEAHCISHWGHDFRPEYRQIGEVRRRMPALAVQAFTATATPAVREDIARQLELRDPLVLVGDFDRPNLTYRVKPRGSLTDQVMGVIDRHRGEAGIVYCLSRRDVETLAGALRARGVRAAAYHAGMDGSERTRVQDTFQGEELDVVVATVAFGMGIDRPDVRFVVHGSLPKGVEQYSQETGRAGRDGLAAECVLFYSGADFHNWKGLMERSAREAAERGVEGAADDVDASLERLGHVWGYATSAVCRHRFLVEYFGQPQGARGPGGCGACDVCLGELARVDDGLVLAQKVLSCVVRCEQRYGASHVTDVLRGADTARIRQAGHDRLSTYGLLRDHTVGEVRSWIEQLSAQGHLASTGGEYPTLHLTRSGVELLRGEREVALFAMQRPTREKKRAASPSITAAAAARAEGAGEPDAALFEHLRGLRRALARERGVPPYLIFNDRTLAAMAALVPTTPEEFRAVKGVGDKKALDLGPVFLRAIAEHRASAAAARPGLQSADGMTAGAD